MSLRMSLRDCGEMDRSLDVYLERLLTGWVNRHRPPVEGRARLLRTVSVEASTRSLRGFASWRMGSFPQSAPPALGRECLGMYYSVLLQARVCYLQTIMATA